MFGRPNSGRDQTPKDPSSAGHSLDKLPIMADAGVKVVDCIQDSYVRGGILAIKTRHGSGDFTEQEHDPPDDVHDPKSRAQCYFRADPPDDRHTPGCERFRTLTSPPGGCPGRQLETTESSTAEC